MTDLPAPRQTAPITLRTVTAALVRLIVSLRPARPTGQEILQAQARRAEARRAVDRLMR